MRQQLQRGVFFSNAFYICYTCILKSHSVIESYRVNFRKRVKSKLMLEIIPFLIRYILLHVSLILIEDISHVEFSEAFVFKITLIHNIYDNAMILSLLSHYNRIFSIDLVQGRYKQIIVINIRQFSVN